MSYPDLWNKINWFAIQTKPSREEQAASNIMRLGVTVLLPRIKREKVEFGNRRVIVKPLFPSYLFARFCPCPYLHSIRYARGVSRVVCAGDFPVPLSEEIISTIQSRISKDGIVKMNPTPFSKGQEVVINEGPFEGLVGIFERDLSDHERAVILLRTVEYQVRVFIDKLRLTPATQLQ